MRINESPRLTLVQGGDGVEESGSASTIYGPVKAGLITPQRINKEVQLTESLNGLERQVETLESRYLEVLDTLNTVIKHLAVLLPFTTSATIIDKEEEGKSALSNSGLKSQGSITMLPTNKEVQLSESLNSLEREVTTLESKFSEACATLTIVMARLAELGLIGIASDLTTTEELE